MKVDGTKFRGALTVALAALLLLLGGCGGVRQAGSNTTLAASGTINHVVVVVLENHSFNQVIGNPAMPFLNSLASQHGLATQYFANTHPSLPNYFMLTTGQTIAQNDGFSSTVTADNVVRALNGAGKTWKAYAESLPSAGYLGPDVFPYAHHHNPFAFFSDVQNSAAQAANIVPFSQFASDMSGGGLPNYSFVIPNELHNAHDCPGGGAGCLAADLLSTTDKWLHDNIGPLVSNAEFQKSGLLIITWDEGARSDLAHGGGQVATVVVGAKTGVKSSRTYQHQNVLATALSVLGVSDRPGASSGAAVMEDLF